MAGEGDEWSGSGVLDGMWDGWALIDGRQLVELGGKRRWRAGKGECRDPGSNRGPLDLQSNALPTELSRRLIIRHNLNFVR